MDVVEKLFDGKKIIANEGLEIHLSEIWRGRIELRPYLLFPVKFEQSEGTLEETETAILYPHTVERDIDKGQLVYGEKRPTRILHYVPLGQHEIVRKPDLRTPHTVKTLGYRELFIEKNDGTEIKIVFDGNCYNVPQGVSTFNNGKEIIQLVEFFDRPSELVNILKKAGIEVYSK